MHLDFLILARNEEINQWLEEHPLVLGGSLLLIGFVVGGWGLYELMSGTARDKFGRRLEGGSAKALAIVRLVAGAGCLLFGMFKIVAG